MSQGAFDVIDEGRSTSVAAAIEGSRVLLDARALETALGWKLEPQGLCRGDVCVPVAGHPGVVRDGSVDLAGFADLLQRPLALDLDERAASVGASARERGAVLTGGIAPDFTLPDVSGREWTLSGFRGKKVLLIAYASW
jgi:hypothetical protein